VTNLAPAAAAAVTRARHLAGQGEGSRGGRIIGHTRNGHPIYAKKSGAAWVDHPDHAMFSPADHRDAASVHARAGNHEAASAHHDAADDREQYMQNMGSAQRSAVKRVRKSEGIYGGVISEKAYHAEISRSNYSRLRAPREELISVGAAPVVTGEHAAMAKSLARSSAQAAIRKALIDSYRKELADLEAANPLHAKVTAASNGWRRPSVPAHMLKSMNVGSPDHDDVVDRAVGMLKSAAQKDTRVRQGLALMKVTPALLSDALDKMRITPENVRSIRA
jgi:hypothetical protein